MLVGPKLNRNISILFKNSVKTIMEKANKNVTVSRKPMSTDSGQGIIKTSPNNAAFKTLPTPTKSESDVKEYKVIQLENGLIACMISSIKLNLESTCEEESDSDAESSESEKDSEKDENESMEEMDYEEQAKGQDSENDEDQSMEELDYEEQAKGERKHRKQKLAAAGLCIGVGSFSDPKAVPGMAHFLEHMVFMGSEKYPKENSFDECIKQSGGSDNASTDTETTVFYFECLEQYFEEALDRFSQFFKAPLMKREAMTREREAIESEFKIALTSDSSRKEQLLCSLAQKDSPVNSFPWGNLITLRDNINDDDLYQGVHEFRKRHYSAHRMTLAVQACLPMEEIQQFVLDNFSQIPNNGLAPSQFTAFQNVFNPNEFNKLYYVIPIKDICELNITWVFPSLISKYRNKPQHIISNLLGDEGKGSILSYLKNKCWVVGTDIGNDESGFEHNALYTLFNVQLNLTEEGYSHINDVIEVIFSYLRMLREIGPQQRIFDELQTISSMGFKYAHEQDPVDFVSNMCEEMQVYPSEDYITGSELFFEYNHELINLLMEEMVPEKANIIVSRKQPQDELKHYQTEKWFGTKYTVKDIPDVWMHQWKSAPINPDLSIPPPNTFITNDFALLPEISNNPDYPQRIMENTLVELWYRRDMHFKLPMAHYYFQLISPLSSYDCKNECMLQAFLSILSIDITEEMYPAISANLSYHFQIYEGNLVIKVWGFNEKLPLLMNVIVRYLNNLSDRITENLFEAIKDKIVKNYYNKSLKPGELAKELRLNLLVNKKWDPVERYYVMSDVSCDDIKKFAKDYLKSLYVKVLVQGNVSDNIAITTVNAFIKDLNYCVLLKEKLHKYHIVRVQEGEECCRIKNIGKDDSNSIIINYYQSDHLTIKNYVILELIMMIIEEPLFDVLRTKEQLGYNVVFNLRDTYGVLGYTITVNCQATKVSTKFVDDRIETFLKYTQSLMADLNEERFQKVKDNLIKMKQCDDIYLKEEVDRNWSEIVTGDYMFDRLKQQVQAIEQTDLNELRSFWEAHNAFGNKRNFRKLSIQVEGNISTSNETCKLPTSNKLQIEFLSNDDEAATKGNENYFIKNIKEYKESLEVYHVK